MTGQFNISALELSPTVQRALGRRGLGHSRISVSRSLSRMVGKWLPSKHAPVSDSPIEDLSVGSDRVFDRVIALQRADGSWELDEALLVACGLSREQLPTLEALVPSAASHEGRRAMATAIALTFLKRRAANDRMEWALLARKADRYLAHVAVQPNGGGTWLTAASALYDGAPTA